MHVYALNFANGSNALHLYTYMYVYKRPLKLLILVISIARINSNMRSLIKHVNNVNSIAMPILILTEYQ